MCPKLVLFRMGMQLCIFSADTCQSLLPTLITMACFQMHLMEYICLSYGVGNHFHWFRLKCPSAYDRHQYTFHIFNTASSISLQTANGKHRLGTPARRPSTGTALASATRWRGWHRCTSDVGKAVQPKVDTHSFDCRWLAPVVTFFFSVGSVISLEHSSVFQMCPCHLFLLASLHLGTGGGRKWVGFAACDRKQLKRTTC